MSAFMHRHGCGLSSRSDGDYLEARDWKEVHRKWILYLPPSDTKKGLEAPGFFWQGPLHANAPEQPWQHFIHQRLQTKIR